MLIHDLITKLAKNTICIAAIPAGDCRRSTTPKGKRMIDLSTLISFLTGLGVDSIVTTIIKYLLDQKSKSRDIWLKEYKEACDGLLDSSRAVAELDSNAAKKSFAHWEARLQLLASEKIINAVNKLKESAPGSEERKMAHKDMISGMRKDL